MSNLCGTQQMYVRNTAIIASAILAAILVIAFFVEAANTQNIRLKERRIEACAHATDVTNCLQRVR